MLKHAQERRKEQKIVGVISRAGSMLNGKGVTSDNGRAPSPELQLIPDLTSVAESNYNSINYHRKMSDRNRAVIRRRAERLRQRDKEIRKRLERVNKKAKPIPAEQDIKLCQDASLKSTADTGSEESINQPTLDTVNVSTNEIGVDSTGNMDLLQHETGNIWVDFHNIHNVCDSAPSLNSVTSQPETGRVESGSQFDINETAVTESENNFVSSRDEVENMDLKAPLERITNEPVEDESVRIPAVKMKAFVGERYCFSKASISPKSTNGLSKEETVPIPTLNNQAMYFYLADMASPCSLGISPKRIKLHKSSKKTRMASTLTSAFTGSVKFSKIRMRKTVLNILKTDKRACNSEIF